MNWQDLEPLLARDVEAFINGRWQVAHFIGFGPGYTDDDIEITVMSTIQVANRSPRQKNHTFICKQSELAKRIRRIVEVESVTPEQPRLAAPLESKFHVGDRVLVTVAIEQIVNEPATVKKYDGNGMYWCVFDKRLDSQWFTEERLRARQANE